MLYDLEWTFVLRPGVDLYYKIGIKPMYVIRPEVNLCYKARIGPMNLHSMFRLVESVGL